MKKKILQNSCDAGVSGCAAAPPETPPQAS